MSVNRGGDKPPQSVIESQVQLPQRFVVGRGGEALPPLRTVFYIDALNLYYGAVRHTPYRWLDIQEFCGAILRERMHSNKNIRDSDLKRRDFKMTGIKMFTASLKEVPWDKGASARQKYYLTALKAHDSKQLIEICHGQFNVRRKTVHDAEYPYQKHKIIHPEEKGTDVNLALHMLNDAVNDEYDCAIMVSNDTDLKNAITMVQEHKKIVGVAFPNPDKRRAAKLLRNNSDFYINVRPELLANCQLPDIVHNTKGAELRKPDLWQHKRQKCKWRGEYEFDFLARKLINTVRLKFDWQIRRS